MTTHFTDDVTSLLGRSLRHVTRSPDTIITTAVVPLFLMLVFVFVLGGAIEIGSDGPYVDYLLPGILLMTIASGVSYTAFRLFLDLQSGIFERFRSMPIARSAILWAHVTTSVVANAVSVLVVVLVAVAMGARPGAGPLGWVLVATLLLLFTLALTWLAVVPGLTASTVEGASAFSYPLIFLPFISSAFVPTDSMPGPVRAFAEHQPVTSVVDALRALLDGRSADGDLAVALAWCVGLLVLAYGVAITVYRRRTA